MSAPVGRIFDEWAAKQQTQGVPDSGVAASSGFAGAARTTFDKWAETQQPPQQTLDLTGTYRQWYTGQNLEGQANGWDTQFVDTAQRQYMESLESGNALNRFERDDAEGVVTWDGAKDSKGNTLEFGDIVSGGRKVANVYEDVDRHTANVLMGAWTIQDGAKTARLNQAADIEGAWDEEIRRIRTESTQQAEVAPRAKAYQEGVEERADEENVGAMVLAGAGGGAALGAAIGSFVPIVGTAVGAALGTGVGALGAWLNQDSLAYQIARERETLDVIREQGNGAGYGGQVASAIAGVANSVALNPLGNVFQGGYDVAVSDFDAGSGGAFYETTDTGERKAAGWVQVASHVAMIGDSLLTFASPVGRGLYTAQMGLGIGGRASGLLPGVGQWDPQKLEMDSVWTDTEGNFNPGSAAAGIGYVGIEAVQLGGVRGLFSQGLQKAGRRPRSESNFFDRANLSKAQRSALRDGGSLETLSGWKFVTNAKGELVGKGKSTLAMLAPSEALQSLSAKAIARRAAAQDKGAISAEKLHQAAFELSVGQRGAQTIMVNAFGEAQEEGLQTFLEPLKHQGSVNPEEIFRAAAGGFAAGLGMGGAAVKTRASADERMFHQAQVAHFVRTGGAKLEQSEWDGMTELQKRSLVRSNDMASSVVNEGWEKMERDRVASEQGDLVAASRVRDWFKKRSTAILERGTKATDASHTIVMLDDSRFRSDAVATSHTQLLKDQQNRTLGIKTQMETLTKRGGELDRLRKQRDETPNDTGVQARITELEAMVLQMEKMRVYSADIEKSVARANRRIEAAYETGAVDDARQIITELNDLLMDAYDTDLNSSLPEEEKLILSKAVARIVTRHPEDSTASFQSFVPQVDHFFAENASDGVAAVSQLTNKGMRSDYDGDKVHELQQLMLSDKEYIDLRSGVNILGASITPEIGTTAYEKWIYDELRVASESDIDTIQNLAYAVGANIKKDLQNWYRGVIPDSVLDEVMTKADEAHDEGGDIRQVILTEMSRLADAELLAIGRGELPFQGRIKYSNQFFEIARMVTKHMQNFQTAYASHRDRPKRGEPTSRVVAPSQHSTDIKTRRGVEAATMAAQAVEVLPGDNLFRMFQKMHYQLMGSTELYVGWSYDNQDYQDLAMFYEQLSRDAVGLKVDDLSASDQVVERVHQQLRALAHNPQTLATIAPGMSDVNNMALLANLETAQYVYAEDPDGQMSKKFTGRKVTLAQQLMYESLQNFRQDHAEVWEHDLTLQSSYNRLIGMTKPQVQGTDGSRPGNAERAFVELFESVPLYDLVGEASASVGVTRTLGQFYRSILNLEPSQRSTEHDRLKNQEQYRRTDENGKTIKHTVPYSLKAVEGLEVTTFRTLVDSVFSAASSQISQTRSGKTKGEITGRMKDQNDEIARTFRTTHEQIRQLIQQVMPQTTYTATDIKNFTEQYPEIGSQILGAIPDSVMPIVYRGQKDGKPYLASWFYELFAEKNSKAAEHKFRWNLWMDEWQAIESGLDIDDNPSDEDKVITWDRLNSRFHRLMYRAASAESGDLATFQELLTRGANATDTESFMDWVNNESGLVGMEAPLLAWVDDTADFDADKTGSGWTQQKSTTQLLEDLRKLRKSAADMIGAVQEDRLRESQDKQLVRSIKRAFAEDRGVLANGEVVSDRDRENYDRFKAAIDNAKKRDLAYGPRAMVMNTAVIAFGMYGQAHTKGSNPEFLAAVEAAESVMGAFGYTVNLERLVGDVTAHNEDAVAASPDLIVKDGGRFMDSSGHQVEWGEQTVETLLDLIDQRDGNIDLIVSMLSPQVMELGFNNRPERQLVHGRSMQDLLNSTSQKDLYNDNGAPGLSQAMKYLSDLETKVRGKSPFSVQQRVTELVVARTSALDHQASMTEIQSMTVQAYMDLAAVLQEIGRTQVGVNQEDPLDKVWEQMQEALRAQAAENVLGITPFTGDGFLKPKDLAKYIETQVREKYLGTITALNDATAASTDAVEQQRLQDTADDVQKRMDSELARMNDLLTGNVHTQTINTYSYDTKATLAAKRAKQKLLMEFVAKNGDVLQGAGESSIIMQRINNYYYDKVRDASTKPPNLTEEQWDTLSKRIITMHLQKLVTVGSSTNPPPAYPDAPKDGKLDKRRYFDFTWAYLADFLAPDAKDGLVEAAREEARTAGKAATERTSDEIRTTLLNRLYKKDSLGEWTAAIPIQSIEGYDLITGASSATAISMAGLITQRQSAVSSATRRTLKVPGAEMDSKVKLVWGDLNWEDDTEKASNLYDRTVDITAPDGRVLKRPLAQINKRFARSVRVTFQHPTDGVQTYDFTNDTQVAYPYPPAYDDPKISKELKVVDLDRIKEALVRKSRELYPNDPAGQTRMQDSVVVNLDFLHPETQPAEPEWFNNLWFEGTIFSSSGDVSDSLLYSLWFGSDGINAKVQQAALDTRKKGLFGIEPYPRPSHADVRALEDLAETDFAAMLAGKTAMIMKTNLGGPDSKLDHDFYNAIYKLMKVKHWVEATVDGQRVRIPAERVIANQAKYGPGYHDDAGNELRNARLWIPSDRVLATLMGETGYGGVATQIQGRLTTNLSDIPTYTGEWSEKNTEDFPLDGLPRRISDTTVSNVLRLKDSRGSMELDPAQRSLFQERWKKFRVNRNRALERRRDEIQKGFNPTENLRFAHQKADEWFSAEDLTVKVPGLPWMSVNAETTLAANRAALSQYITGQQGETGNKLSGWVLQYNGPSVPAQGLLTQDNIDSSSVRVAPGEPVVVDFGSFRQGLDYTEARKAARAIIRKLASLDAAIIPVSSVGPSDLATEMAAELRGTYGYERYADNPRVLVPNVMRGRRHMNAAAAQNSLTESRGVTIRRQRLLGLLKGKAVEENTMLVPQRDRASRFATVQYQRNLLPLNVAARFGVPKTRQHLDMTIAHLEGINSSDAAKRELMERLVDENGKPQPGQKDFLKMWDRMMDRIYESRAQNTTLPVPGQEFGTGDIIPLLSDQGELLLYRHGYEFPYKTFNDQLRLNEPGREGPRKVAVYSGKPMASATTHVGTVTEVKNKQKYGLQLELEIPSNTLGSKQVFEVNGMKWLVGPLGDQMVEPNAALLGSGDRALDIDGYGALADSLSKQATDGIVNNFRNAFAVFGADHIENVRNFFGTDRDTALRILRAIERAPNKNSIKQTKELQDLTTGSSAYMQAITQLIPGLESLNVDTSWVSNLQQDTTDAFITRAMLLYLTTEGSSLDAVRYSSGFYVEDNVEDAQSQLMPRLYTRMFDKLEMGSPIRQELFDGFNDKLGKNGSEGWYIDPAWNLIGTNANGEEIEMVLDFGEAHVSDDNPELNVQAQDRRNRQGTSMHASLVTEFGVGGDVFPDPKRLAKIDKALGRQPRDRIEAGEIWESLTNIDARAGADFKPNPATYGPGSHWQKRSPAEHEYYGMSMQRYIAYRQVIDWDQEGLQENKSQLELKRKDVAVRAGLHESQAHMVDYWIRQMLYRPGAMPGQTDYDDKFESSVVMDTLDQMLSSMEKGRFPTYEASGPQMISEHDLLLLFNAAQSKRSGWRPYAIDGDKSTAVGDNYGDWIRAAFGQAFNRDVEIDEMTRLDLDGHMNTYGPMLKDMGHMYDITLDQELQGRFLDPQTNELIAVTTSPVERRLLMEQVIMPRLNIGFEGLRKGVGTAESEQGQLAQSGWKSHSRRRVAAHRRKNKIRPYQRESARDYVQYGAKVLDSNGDMHSLSRILIALRHGTTMLNPGLYISMIPEQGFRTYLNGMANVLTGEATGRGVGGITAKLGINMYDTQQINALNRLYTNMANDNSFAGLIIKDLMWQQPGNDKPGGRVVRAAERYAAIGNKWQDPTWGMPQRMLAQHYVEAVLRQIQARPISNVMSVESAIAHLERDPGYFAKNHKDIHQIASNSVVDFRGLRHTPWSLAVRAAYEPLTRSSSPTLQFAGLLVKLPAMYANFNMNMLTTITGMQGYTQMLATFLDARETRGTLMHRIFKKLKGEELSVEDDIRYDMSSTMDGYTMVNAFIRGGVTQTGLFTLGMLAGGVLSGDDDEAKRRRRLAKAQNAPFVADMRRLEADFRNKDMVFLDWLPPSLQSAFMVGEGENARSAVQISWLMKPFISPIIGMEKFFMTGDFGWVTYGFMDAIGSLPLFNKALWDDTVRSVDELQALAAEQAVLGTPENTRNSMYLLVSAVGLYERMLFENMFVNSIYTGFDTWDRDPSKLVLRDSDGDPQKTIQDVPRENDVALQSFINDKGEVQEGYLNRGEMDKLLAYYSENNFSAMAALSLMTGFQKDLNRYQMPVKMHELELPQITDKEAETLVATALQQAWQAQGNTPHTLSLEEITRNLSSEAASSGNWDVYNNVDAIAAGIFESEENQGWTPMSVLGIDGNEELTTAGMETILNGLRKGSISLDHPAMKGVAIPFEMRQKIQDDFMADVMQEGVDLGLTRTQASYRAQRLLSGPKDDNSVLGFADILWSDKIPYSNKRKYQQLNTTYVKGPDGYPWATGFKRGGVIQQLGGLKRPSFGPSGSTGVDGRMNTVDLVAGINTGMRGLVPFNETENIPTDQEIGDAIVEAIEKLDRESNDYEPFSNEKSNGGFYRGGGWRRFPRRSYGGYRRSGYSGGSSYSPTIYYSRQPYLADGRNVFGDSTRNIFWDSGLIRRTTIRRERTSSQRGRLNQWQ